MVHKNDVGVHAHGAQIVPPAILKDLSSEDKALFTRALHDLHLDVDVHPMSFTSPITSDKRSVASCESSEIRESRAATLSGMKWPMRVQVVKMVHRHGTAEDHWDDSDSHGDSDDEDN
jgi:hypothetical protein